MRKVIALLFACMCIFSSCSAKGYWMAKEPVARTDGTYHIQDQIPYSSEGTRIFKDGEPTELFIYLDDIIVSDGMMDVIIPIKAHVPSPTLTADMINSLPLITPDCVSC